MKALPWPTQTFCVSIVGSSVCGVYRMTCRMPVLEFPTVVSILCRATGLVKDLFQVKCAKCFWACSSVTSVSACDRLVVLADISPRFHRVFLDRDLPKRYNLWETNKQKTSHMTCKQNLNESADHLLDYDNIPMLLSSPQSPEFEYFPRSCSQ